jgi:hypothetical protein
MRSHVLTVAITLALTLGSVAGYKAVAAERQPHMAAALHHLEEAEKELQAAEADKGGHREKAIGLTRSAMEETRAGIEFADRH